MITGIGINDVEAHRPVSDPITNMKFNINFDNVKISGDSVLNDAQLHRKQGWKEGVQGSPFPDADRFR